MQCTEYSEFWLKLIFAALNLTFIAGQKAFPVFNADRVIIRLPCGQGQLSRIWKVQCDWLSLGKECCFPLSWRLWGGKNTSSPKNACVGGYQASTARLYGFGQIFEWTTKTYTDLPFVYTGRVEKLFWPVRPHFFVDSRLWGVITAKMRCCIMLFYNDLLDSTIAVMSSLSGIVNSIRLFCILLCIYTFYYVLPLDNIRYCILLF